MSKVKVFSASTESDVMWLVGANRLKLVYVASDSCSEFYVKVPRIYCPLLLSVS